MSLHFNHFSGCSWVQVYIAFSECIVELRLCPVVRKLGELCKQAIVKHRSHFNLSTLPKEVISWQIFNFPLFFFKWHSWHAVVFSVAWWHWEAMLDFVIVVAVFSVNFIFSHDTIRQHTSIVCLVSGMFFVRFPSLFIPCGILSAYIYTWHSAILYFLFTSSLCIIDHIRSSQIS